MDIGYFKRFRMEIHLAGRDLRPAAPSNSYRFTAWGPPLLDAFARAKFLGFRNEIDTRVFPCLADFRGCRRLMEEIVGKPGFLPEATWLVVHCPDERAHPRYCGTVQGVRDRYGRGMIQNLCVTGPYRRRGLGIGLLLRSLEGFRRAGVRRVFLEVTAANQDAIRLYRRVGFSAVRTVYKAVEASYSN
jgi:ribosomal protein S18 acetylase RimI-like enzyme